MNGKWMGNYALESWRTVNNGRVNTNHSAYICRIFAVPGILNSSMHL